MQLNDGTIILIDKPSGITSYDCIRILQKYARQEKGERVKLGHAGTLDPMASGLLLIGVGSATKKLGELLKLPKTYEAEILLGVQTDTGDIEGVSIQQWDVPDIPDSQFETTTKTMVRTHTLPVPQYSAIKQGGEPLYKKARRGEEVQTPVREMEVKEATLLSVLRDDARYRVRVRFHVSSGTYVRSLAEEFGRCLGVPATLSALRRTHIGEYDIADAQQLPDV